MKYLKRIIKIVSAILLIAIAVMLVIVFMTHGGEKNDDIPADIGKIIVALFLIILCAAVLVIIVAVPTGIVVFIKRKGAKRFTKSLSISFSGGVVIFVATSLIKYRTFFSLDLIYIPIVLAVIPAFSFFLWDDENCQLVFSCHSTFPF